MKPITNPYKISSLLVKLVAVSSLLVVVSMGCAKIKGLGIDYSRWGDQNIEGFDFTQTLPDGTVNQVKFSKQKGGDALLEALRVANEAIKRIPIVP